MASLRSALITDRTDNRRVWGPVFFSRMFLLPVVRLRFEPFNERAFSFALSVHDRRDETSEKEEGKKRFEEKTVVVSRVRWTSIDRDR